MKERNTKTENVKERKIKRQNIKKNTKLRKSK